jgi:hypothetical protein
MCSTVRSRCSSPQIRRLPMSREEAYQNEVIRASAHHGLSILNEMEKDLVEAWLSHDQLNEEEGYGSSDQKIRVVRGRIRGIAQCIALIRSPYSRRELGPTSRRWMDVIKQTEDEGHARARLQMRRSDG